MTQTQEHDPRITVPKQTQSIQFQTRGDLEPPNNVCRFSIKPRSHQPSILSKIDLRLDRTLSRSGLRGPPSMTPANGCGGSGGKVPTGLGVSLTRTLEFRTGAVGGGGNHG